MESYNGPHFFLSTISGTLVSQPVNPKPFVRSGTTVACTDPSWGKWHFHEPGHDAKSPWRIVNALALPTARLLLRTPPALEEDALLPWKALEEVVITTVAVAETPRTASSSTWET
jgi:hypothetical protein